MITVIRRANSPEDHPKSPLWECECSCGNVFYVTSNNLLNGNTHSCGCYKRNMCSERSSARIKHGAASVSASDDQKRLFRIWVDMRRRCSNAERHEYAHYGGRGIHVCDEWDNSFIAFYEWALLNGYSSGLTIDRIDVNDGYCPQNCRWADDITQANNTTTNHMIEYNGETHTIAEWSRITGIKYSALIQRINANWSIERALSEPVRSNTQKKI